MITSSPNQVAVNFPADILVGWAFGAGAQLVYALPRMYRTWGMFGLVATRDKVGTRGDT